MDADERARLRALCEDVALPLRAECTLSGHELVDANDEYIGDIETEHSDDDEWCDEVHADLIVGAVNALPALLDDADAADARSAKAERERDEARDRVAVLETVLREIAGSLRSHERMGPRWCLHCGVAWWTQHVATCPAGRALRVLDGRDAR